jgi:hypothetical protein
VNHPHAKEKAVVDVVVAQCLDPEQGAIDPAFIELSSFDVRQQPTQPFHGIAMGTEIPGVHIGTAAAQGRDHRNPGELASAQDLGQRMLECPITPVDDQQLDVLTRKSQQCLGNGTHTGCLYVMDVGVIPQQFKDLADPVIAGACAEIIE